MNRSQFFACVVLWHALSTPAFAQAAFILWNYYPGAVNAPVFGADGRLIPAGSSYRAELWGSANPETLQPCVKYLTDWRSVASFTRDGYFSGADPEMIAVDLAPGEEWAWLQVRVWDMSLAPTYEETAQLQIGGYGESPVFYARGNLTNPHIPPPSAVLVGLQSFSVRPIIPEPAPVALLLLGGAAVWFKRRRAR